MKLTHSILSQVLIWCARHLALTTVAFREDNDTGEITAVLLASNYEELTLASYDITRKKTETHEII